MTKQEKIREGIADIILDGVDENGNFDVDSLVRKIQAFEHSQGVVIKKDIDLGGYPTGLVAVESLIEEK